MPVDASPAVTVPTRCTDDNALWLMSLADLMLVLLAFFVLLAVADPPRPVSAAGAPLPAAPPALVNPVGKEPAPPPRPSSTDGNTAAHRAPARTGHDPADLIRSLMVQDDDRPPTGRLAPSADPALAPADRLLQPRRVKVPRAMPQAPRAAPTPAPPPARPTEPQVAKESAPTDEYAQALGTAEARLREIFRSAGDHAEISAGPGAVTVRLRDTITFTSGSAHLLPGVRPLLGRVAGWLETHPEIELEISGHTDDVPIATPQYPSNWELSAARAAAVARELLDGSTIDPRRAHIAGYGEHRPLPPAQGSAGDRARNRRVEIRFLLPVSPTS